MFLLAAASIPMLLLEQQWTPARWLGWLIVGLFAADLSVRVLIAPDPRLKYLKSHWLDALIVVLSLLPLLRPLRMLRAVQLLRPVRLALFAARARAAARKVWGEIHGKVLLLGCGAVAVIALGVVYAAERAAADSSIHSAETTLWWAVTTITTVGYGDTSPVTLAGRVAAAALMVVGISMFGLITANVSARFIRQDTRIRTLDIAPQSDSTNFCPTCGSQLPQPEIAPVHESAVS